jgi:protein arginine kinase activator
MECNICKKNPATVHITQVVGNHKVEVHMCAGCAAAKGIPEAKGFSLADLQVGLGAGDELAAEPGVRCPVCGFTQADFKKTGRLGCSACWETFEAGLVTLLRAMHKSDRHVGKVPSKAAHTLVITEQIKELSADLERAVRDEKYEDAAQIRDRIRQLESQLKGAGGGR